MTDVREERVMENPILNENRRRASFLRAINYMILVSQTMLALTYLGTGLLVPQFPMWPLLLGSLFNIALLIVSLRFLSHEQFTEATIAFLVGATIVLLVGFQYLGGVTGPVALALPVLLLIVGLVARYRVSTIVTAVLVVIYALLLVLETLDVFKPVRLSGNLQLWVFGGIMLFVLLSTELIVRQFMKSNQRAIAIAQEKSRQLEESQKRAQVMAESERRARTQELQISRTMSETVSEYTNFLEWVNQGDYSARLDLEAMKNQENFPQELLSLGEYLNRTVDTMSSALREAQEIQRLYVSRAWEEFATVEERPLGFRYSGEDVSANDDVWLPLMEQAVKSRVMTVETQELSLPIDLRGQVIGALGLRRDGRDSWSDEEVALVTAVTDQLAQTIENLRLLDETSRRAAREQAAGEITARIRSEMEIEKVLERALVELGDLLRAERGAAHLGLKDATGGQEAK